MVEKGKNIAYYRDKIDQIDEDLLKLFNMRADCALEIGIIKKAQNLPVYVPEREKAVIEKMTGANKGPLSNEAITTLFTNIFQQMKNLENEV